MDIRLDREDLETAIMILDGATKELRTVLVASDGRSVASIRPSLAHVVLGLETCKIQLRDIVKRGDR